MDEVRACDRNKIRLLRQRPYCSALSQQRFACAMPHYCGKAPVAAHQRTACAGARTRVFILRMRCARAHFFFCARICRWGVFGRGAHVRIFFSIFLRAGCRWGEFGRARAVFFFCVFFFAFLAGVVEAMACTPKKMRPQGRSAKRAPRDHKKAKRWPKKQPKRITRAAKPRTRRPAAPPGRRDRQRGAARAAGPPRRSGAQDSGGIGGAGC